MLVFICRDNLVLVSNPCAWAEARGSGAQLASGGGLAGYFACALVPTAQLITNNPLFHGQSQGQKACTKLSLLYTICWCAALELKPVIPLYLGKVASIDDTGGTVIIKMSVPTHFTSGIAGTPAVMCNTPAIMETDTPGSFNP